MGKECARMKKQPAITIPKRNSHDPRWNELGKYIRKIADAMGLAEWYFTISHDAPDEAVQEGEEATAQVYISSQSVKFIYSVGDLFWKKNQYEQRWSVVYELTHVLEAPYINALYTGFEASATTKAVVNQLRERFIDQVSLMISRRFELPPKGFKKKAVSKSKKKVGHVPHNVSRKRGEADL
jgi:hypothetical protein